MNYLIIYAHPSSKSKNARLKDFVEQHLKSEGHQVITRDLYELGFQPVLSLEDIQGQMSGAPDSDVSEEQNYIAAADCLIFIHPIWWTGLPAILKGYIERVFSYGFAYRYDKGVQKGLLKGKSCVIINTQGKSSAEYQAIGMDKALRLTSDTGIYRYVGLAVKKHFFFTEADRASESEVATWMSTLEKYFQLGKDLKASSEFPKSSLS